MRTEDHQAPSSDLAHRFTAALAARDRAALRSLFGDHVDFRALTPGQIFEAETPDVLVNEVILGIWFDSSDEIRRMDKAETDRVGNRTRISYRLQVRNPTGHFVVEQQAFLELTDGQITWLRLLCSGFLPIPEPSIVEIDPNLQPKGALS